MSYQEQPELISKGTLESGVKYIHDSIAHIKPFKFVI